YPFDIHGNEGREADCNWDRRPHECGGQAVRKHWCAEMVSKIVVKVDVHDDKDKKKAMKAVSSLQEPKKGEEEKKKDPNEQIAELVKAYKAYNPCMTTYYSVQSAEENPNACVVM
ncbi:heavy metal-associated domain containing protein, partial [Musa troglodytarum]